MFCNLPAKSCTQSSLLKTHNSKSAIPKQGNLKPMATMSTLGIKRMPMANLVPCFCPPPPPAPYLDPPPCTVVALAYKLFLCVSTSCALRSALQLPCLSARQSIVPYVAQNSWFFFPATTAMNAEPNDLFWESSFTATLPTQCQVRVIRFRG